MFCLSCKEAPARPPPPPRRPPPATAPLRETTAPPIAATTTPPPPREAVVLGEEPAPRRGPSGGLFVVGFAVILGSLHGVLEPREWAAFAVGMAVTWAACTWRSGEPPPREPTAAAVEDVPEVSGTRLSDAEHAEGAARARLEPLRRGLDAIEALGKGERRGWDRWGVRDGIEVWFHVNEATGVKDSVGVTTVDAPRDAVLAALDEKAHSPEAWDKQFKKLTILETYDARLLDGAGRSGLECALRRYEYHAVFPTKARDSVCVVGVVADGPDRAVRCVTSADESGDGGGDLGALRAAARAAFDAFIAEIDAEPTANGWTRVGGEDGVSRFLRPSDDGGKDAMSRGVVRAPASAIDAAIAGAADEVPNRLERMQDCRTTVASRPSGGLELPDGWAPSRPFTVDVLTYKKVWPLATREAVILGVCATKGDVAVRLGTSVDHPAAPDAGRVRLDVRASGYHIRPLGPRETMVTTVSFVAPGGAPAFIVDRLATSRTHLVAKIRQLDALGAYL
ncbi:hypothetical protein AURANDRAFT_71498 [Aureococcus anophagefferens]|uniref:START domain-containing protein n=1 Tax=Aureococcus anophagefferens TaxID=44056 RepID=F0Y6L4_AURAN|nr:hypothetical protein AURANDRAFT_71498 [Aureococcus anophagefferens]EGB09158.1 hypothetical protein AURANDRAFT_71498 [Aureococcus anophagefferens]|eukprot:XP_009036269.1 hypothetical protein AURANDRAFT_71498 [Aureococcus anophagefferens]